METMRTSLVLLAWTLMLVEPSYAQRTAVRPDEPPHQHTPWHAPRQIPANLLSAIRTLFEQGFPDPRGCGYREIVIEVSSVWGHPATLARTRGWVLPETPGVPEHYAIAWNGVVYPVLDVGARADLQAEAAALVPPPSRRFNTGLGEVWSVYATNARLSRVLLLARCGEIDAGLKSWVPDQQTMTQLQLQMNRPPAKAGRVESYDPYLELAGDWAWALFDHLLCAHMRGQESLALAGARRLAELERRIEREAAKRGFQRPRYEDWERRGKEGPYLAFLEQLPRLLSDLERRTHEGQRESVVHLGLDQLETPATRIHALVRDLDVVEAHQWGQPGRVELSQDPIVAALIREGEPAVEPLLDCLESDKRLTRSVGFHRDFFRDRTVLSVASAARTALQCILHTESSTAADLRVHWKQFKGTALEDRWYSVLKDDAAGLARWREAAAKITEPENVTSVPGAGFRRVEPADSPDPVRMRGESLRNKSDPSVAALLARRAVEVPENKSDDYDLATACEIALSLAAWNTEAAAPVAKILVERCRTAMEYSNAAHSWPVQRLGTFIARLTMIRARAANAGALDDYAAWLKTTTPERLGSAYLMESLEPLGKFPVNPALRAAAETLFNATNSAWGNFPWKGAAGHNVIESELISVPAFGRLLGRELDKTNVVGWLQWDAPGNVRYQIERYESGSRRLVFSGMDELSPGLKVELRWCDWIAWSLSNAKRIPFFNPFGTIDQRDKAIAAARETLTRN